MNQPDEQKLITLLGMLCNDLGFCLPKLVASRLVKFPPRSSERFARAVIEAGGLTIETIDKSLYKRILAEVESAYEG